LLTNITFSEIIPLHGIRDVKIRKAGMEIFTLFSPCCVILPAPKRILVHSHSILIEPVDCI
jgi:hypothetical protein